MKNGNRTRERGGVTIVVALLLLALMMVWALAMSRTSMQEVMITGAMKQGLEVRNVADGGLEWAMTHMQPDPTGLRATGDGAGDMLKQMMLNLQSDPELQGSPLTLVAQANTPMVDTFRTGAARTFDVELIRMGKLKMALTSVGQVADTLHPDFWSVRSKAQLKYDNGPTFRHTRELWLSTPAAGTVQ